MTPSNPSESSKPARQAPLPAALAQAAAKTEQRASSRIPGHLLTDLIAETPFVQTWRCWNSVSGKILIAKIFTDRKGARWQAQQRDLKTLATRLRNLEADLHILSYVEADLDFDPPYLLMESIEGGSLRAKISASRPAAVDQAVSWMQQMADGLAFMHAEGIFHGNLKPSNVLLNLRGRVQITDFCQLNLAQAAASDTLAFVAPELVSQGALGELPRPDVRSDIFSLGACVYALLSGGPQLVARPLTLKELRAATGGRVDDDLLAILARCMHPEPRRRYESAALILADLKARREMRPVSPLARNSGYRLRKFMRRNRLSLAAALVVSAALGVVFAQGLSYAREVQRQLIYSYVLRAGQYADRKDYPSAAACFAQLNRLAPSPFARANTLAFLDRMDSSRVLINNAQGISSAVISPDSKFILAGNQDFTAQRWNLDGSIAGGALIHENSPLFVAISPDSRLLLTGGLDKTARIWDAKTGKPSGAPLRHPNFVGDGGFSPDGRLFYTQCKDAVVRIWGTEDRKPRAAIRADKSALFIRFMPDGRRILICDGNKNARIWDVRTGKARSRSMPHSGDIFAVDVSADGSLIGIACGDRNAYLWDAKSGAPVGHPMPHGDQVKSIAFSPDGSRLATGAGDKIARLWDIKTGLLVGAPMEHQGWVEGLSFSPDGKQLLTASLDKTARRWNALTGAPEGNPMFHASSVHSALYSANGRFIVTRTIDGSLHVYDIAKKTGSQSSNLHPELWSSAFAISSDCRRAAAASFDGKVTLWETQGGLMHALNPPHAGWVPKICFSPDGRMLATGSVDLTVRLWDAASGRALGPAIKHPSTPMLLAFSPDGSALAVACDDNSSSLWRTSDGKPMGRPIRHGSRVVAMAFTPDGKSLLVGNDDANARLWDPYSGQMLGKPMAHQGPLSSVAVSPDGGRFLTAAFDQNAKLWDSRSCDQIGQTMHEEALLLDARFSPDGERLVTACNGNSTRIWDAHTGILWGKEMPQEWGVSAVAFSPDGRMLATSTFVGLVQIWDCESGEPVGPAFQGKGPYEQLSFSPDMRSLLGSSISVNSLSRWDLHWLNEPIEADELTLKTEVATFRHFDKNGSLLKLSIAEWRALNEKLYQLY